MDNYAQQTGLVRSIVFPLIILALVTAGWYYVTQDETPLPPAPRPEVESRTVPDEDSAVKKRQRFYRQQVKPELQQARRSNLQALQDLYARINDLFTRYRRGVKPFSEDLTSMGTRFWVLWEMTGGEDDVKRYVRSKFEKHIFSKKELANEIDTALKSYQEQLEANRNQLLSSVRAAVKTSDVQVPAMPNLDEYSERVTQNMQTFVADKATDSALNGVSTLVLGEVIAYVGETVCYAIITRVGTTAATTAAASGGAAATGAGTGAAGGSTVGPVGTAIGFGVGLAIGVAVDWYMTERFRAKLEKQMTTYLSKVQEGLIKGVEKEGERTPGIQQVLGEYTRTMNRAQRRQMKLAVTGGNQ